MVGRINTVKLDVNPETSPSAPPSTPIVEAGPAGDRILVISGGINSSSCADNIITSAWKSNRIQGAIIDGMCRDNTDVRQAEYPVFGRGLASERLEQAAQASAGAPIQIQGFEVCQDDYVIADESGTVFVSAERIEKVLEASEGMHRRQNPKRGSAEDQELVALLAGLDTPAVSDALDKLGIPGQALNIMPLANYSKVTVGPAYTVRYVPASDPPEGVGDFIDDVAAGDVIVIDNAGRTDCTVWGDIMTQYAGIRGIAGTVIDGVCRDVNRALSDDYPIFTAGRWMRTGKDRVQVGGVNEAVGFGRVHVQPRDMVVADANGVVVVPRARAREVAGLARWIEKCEEGIREKIAGGATLGKAREELSYHQLQRKN